MSVILPQGALHAARLQSRFGDSEPIHVLAAALGVFDNKLALVSSFGAESAVLLHLAAQIDPSIDVIFINTGKIFGETKRYRDKLAQVLKLENVITHGPDEASVRAQDSRGDLWLKDPDSCCVLRKVEPLNDVLQPYDAWITGRKRSQTLERKELQHFEWDGVHIKVNPLAGWKPEQVQSYIEEHNLPQHILKADGFLSIGCMPCTERVDSDEDSRSGRWRGRDKQECGIHKMRA